ncbi:RNA polymerase recycling motor HelD [Solibacillus sp. CAU 1738]|uniref:RNA polymerase recycling motor HelD n=1 Tax=Solibacillus sp. CAU 1738 TaxID=3140363 RepID=UPI00326092BD
MEQTIWQQEQQHLKEISTLLKQYIEELKIKQQKKKGNIIDERTSMSDSFNDISGERAIEFSQLLPGMQLKEREFLNLSELLVKMEILYKSPYFGRITMDNEAGDLENLYIGLSTFRDNQGDVLIYDWRAPISSLFYENRVGQCQFQVPDGEKLTVDVKGRRQYKTSYDQLLQLFDADIYIGDEVLQNLLADTAKEKMKSIVATIQSDQNAVIRSSNRSNIIVLGPPGSGKTSVAMQRIAYLLYEYRQTMNARSILLISPSDLFNDYISNVLPELGEENVQHTTYYRLFKELRLPKYNIETNYENIERLQKADTFARENYAYKNSHLYANRLLAYIEQLKTKGFPFYNLKMGEELFISAKQLTQLFYGKFAGLDIDFRLKKIRTNLIELLEKEKKKAFTKRLKQLKAVNTFIGDDYALEQQANNEVNQRFGKLASTIDQLGFANIHKMYLNSLVTEQDDLFTRDIQAITAQRLKKHTLYYEDTAPILYLYLVIKGLYTDNSIKHIVIDEVQDYSYLQLLAITQIHPKAHFTLLGDRNQLVHPSKKDAIDNPLVNQFTTVELNKSYRSTNEITNFMSAIINNTTTLSLGVSGDKPKILKTDNRYSALQFLIQKFYNDGDSFVILCKNRESCETLYEQLKEEVPDLTLITEKQKVYMKGLLIMPGYMAKGFEFTTVVLADADATVYSEAMDAYLLYTIASRATRQLAFVTTGELPHCIQQIDEQLYNVIDNL